MLRAAIIGASLWLAVAAAPSLEEARALYLDAIDSSDGADALVASLANEDLAAHPVLLGYLGTGHALQARHAFNPYTKYQLFTTGKNELEAAIKAKPSSAELRFLRFTVQENAPGFLGYNQSLEADKAAIIDFLMETEANTGIFVVMRAHLLASDATTSAEKDRLSASTRPPLDAETD